MTIPTGFYDPENPYGRESGGPLFEQPSPAEQEEIRKAEAGLSELNVKGQEAAKQYKPPPGLFEPVVVQATNVEEVPVQWLWWQRFPLGKLVIFSGDPGQGKTYLMLDLMARGSTGERMPCGASAGLFKSCYISFEDDAGDTLVPRYRLLGGDPRNLYLCNMVKHDDEQQMLQLDRHLPAFEKIIQQTGAKLICIDPISAALGDTKSHENADVRGLLAPLQELAAAHKVCIVGINHLCKARTGLKAMYRSMGSLAFVAAARAAWQLEEDADQKGRRLFLQVKNNLGEAPGLAFTIEEGKLIWEDHPIDNKVDDDVEELDRKSQLSEAVEFLRQATFPVTSKQIMIEAKGAGVEEKTLRRAKAKLGIRAVKVGSEWHWKRPEEG